MARHSFIQMSKLSNVKGRISYISDPKRQEYLYATFSTREDMTFWNDLAKECQEEFKRFGTEGKCIEARELIIALPEEYTKFDPNQVLREFTEQFKKRYDVECVSALHHNKTKKNYHIHLIFSERRLLPEPEVKIATRSVFYDELGKRVRTKKEIPGEDGQIREGCIVIKKGEAYEKHLFTAKDEVFKNELFLDEAKQFYTALINRHIHDPERRLKVFDPNSVYLPTKKIGKNNPKEAEIEADNAARQDWNRTADMALVSGIEELRWRILLRPSPSSSCSFDRKAGIVPTVKRKRSTIQHAAHHAVSELVVDIRLSVPVLCVNILRHLPRDFIIGFSYDSIHSVTRHTVDEEIFKDAENVRSFFCVPSVPPAIAKRDFADFLQSFGMRGKDSLNQIRIPRFRIMNLILKPAVDIAFINDVFQCGQVSDVSSTI